MKTIADMLARLPLKRRYLRLGAWLLVALLGYSIFLQWQQQFGGQTQQSQTTSSVSSSQQSQTAEVFENEVLNVLDDQPSADADIQLLTSSNEKTLRVKTDVLEVEIAAEGGDIIAVWLLEYKRQVDNPEPIQLLRKDIQTYIAQSGLVGPDGPDSKQRPTFAFAQDSYRLESGQEQIEIAITAVSGDLILEKTYKFTKGSYLIEIYQKVLNQKNQQARMRQFGQIRRGAFEPEVHASSGFGIRPYFGAALTTPDTRFEKVDFDDMRDADLRVEMQGGWISMLQHYFITSWIANPEDNNVFLTRKAENNQFIVGYVGPTVTLNSGQQFDFVTRLYIGPKTLDRLEPLAPNLGLTVDFGWLWFIATPLFRVLEWLHGYVGNWGFAIVLLTVLVKLVFFYPSQLSYRSMARMRKLAPQMRQLRTTHGSDKSKLQQEMMALYRREKVNPLGGCLPILIQMPVFIALYWMLLESVQIRHAPFILWINDLTAIDPYFVLPLLMGATMFIQQLLSPAPPDPTQAKIMRMLPIVFTFMFLWFPSGLVLYWVTNNTLSIIQQWVITRSIK